MNGMFKNLRRKFWTAIIVGLGIGILAGILFF
jgi:hypothetical protein